MGPLPCPTVRRPSHGLLRRRIENSRARGSSNPRRFAESLVTFADGAARAASSSRHASRSVFRRFFFFFRVSGRGAFALRRDVLFRSWTVDESDSRGPRERNPLDLHSLVLRLFFFFAGDLASRGFDGRSRQAQPYRPAKRCHVHFLSSLGDFHDAFLDELHRDRSRGVHQLAPPLGAPAAHQPRGLAGSHGLVAPACAKHGQDHIAEALGRVGKGKDTTSVEPREGCA